ncbi:MAG: hypothetical protein C4K49_05480 [Candidatus Thorarchaeota archaeon]|nr:MAG: hypothetical protein C4K49_05480 [Candidatus Thorarchaeota archaeon]
MGRWGTCGHMHNAHVRNCLPADVSVRLLKKMGADITFVCGSDTHVTLLLTVTEAAGVSHRELYVEYHEHYLEIVASFPILIAVLHHVRSCGADEVRREQLHRIRWHADVHVGMDSRRRTAPCSHGSYSRAWKSWVCSD